MPQAPFPAPHILPCTVEAEEFDAGGEGVAYSDSEPANQGNSNLRAGEGVDIDTAGGVTSVGYTRDGEYLKYSVDASSAGSVSLALRAANPDSATKSLKVYLDGAPAGEIPVNPTGDWNAYQDFAATSPLAVTAGRHIVTIAFEGVGRINLDRLVLSTASPTATPTPTATETLPPIVLPTPTPTSTQPPELQNASLPAIAGAPGAPLDPDLDGRYEDVNGNSRVDFSDVVLLFNNLSTVPATHPTGTFDFNRNGRTDYGDVTTLYNRF